MAQEEERYDAVIVGAGFSGIYQLIQLRRLGLRCVLFEAGSDLGGVWHWNHYPGARVDISVPLYELPLPELWSDWTWTERFPSWRELQSYFKYVGEKMNLRPDCRFNTLVEQAHWDERLHLWHIAAEGKQGSYKATARYLILCTGITHKPYIPSIPGYGSFKGPCCHTSRWPKEGIEVAGKRVGVIGTGASGVQVVQEIGPQVAHLTVFQRTPNIALPLGQYSLTKQAQNHFKSVYDEIYKRAANSFGGGPSRPILRPMLSDSEEERDANFEKLWEAGGFTFLVGNYQDLNSNKASNRTAYEFWRKKVGGRIRDPAKRAILAPETPPNPIGAKRHSLETSFYEVFNQDNVDLVDLNATPIVEMTENGIKTASKVHDLDVIIFGTGFDSYVGGFFGIDLRGLDGKTIQDHWKNGVTTYLGLAIDKFPNLFFLHGPQGPAALCNAPICVDIQGRWINQTITYLDEHGVTKFTPTSHAALAYKKHVDELCNATLLPEANSWYMGANIPGKKREAYNYLGGVGPYTKELEQELERGYPGFTRETLTQPNGKAY